MKYLVLIFLLCVTAHAQDFEYGKPSEFKGLGKIYVDTGTDLKNHDSFAKEIEKAKISSLQIVENAKDADIIVTFAVGATSRIIGSGGSVNTITKPTGSGFIAIQGHDKTKPRILMNFDYVRRSPFSDNPAEKMAKEFVKQYKIANGLK